MQMIHVDNKATKRFWKYVDRREDDECWPWLGGSPDKPPTFSVGGAVKSARRVMWDVYYGTPPPHGMVLMLMCGSAGTECINPMHMTPLKPGTKLAKKGSAPAAARPDIHQLAAMVGVGLERTHGDLYKVVKNV